MADLDTIERQEQEEDHEQAKRTIMFWVDIVIYAVVGFCEVLYVAMLIPAFPDGLVRLVAIGGACATGASAVLLLKGKLYWFTKGRQSGIAWGFVAVEVAVLALNVILAVQLHNNNVNDWMQWWEGFYPAAPVVALVGWGLILYSDKSNVMRARRRNQRDRQEMAELDYEKLVHATKMQVKHNSLKTLATMLEEKMASSENLLALEKTASQIADNILSEISGQHVTSRIPQSKMVEGSLAQQAQIQPPPPATSQPETKTSDVMSSSDDSTPVPQESGFSMVKMFGNLLTGNDDHSNGNGSASPK